MGVPMPGINTMVHMVLPYVKAFKVVPLYLFPSEGKAEYIIHV